MSSDSTDSLKTGNRFLKRLIWNIPFRLDLLVLFLVAFGIRLIILEMSIDQIGVDGIIEISADSKAYIGMAQDILSGTSNHEKSLVTFGPGFAYLLAVFIGLFGRDLIPFILMQIIVSSLSCLLIYRLSALLTHSYLISLVAGVMAAFSCTSVMLSIAVLSETAYFAIFLLSLIFYVRGFEQNRWAHFIISGILVGAAVLLRSVGQLWPIIMIALAYPLARLSKPHASNLPHRIKPKITKAVVAALIAVAIVSVWVVRNASVHGLPIVASAGVNGAVKVTTVVLERVENRPAKQIWQEWSAEYMKEKKIEKMSEKDTYLFYVSKTREIFGRYRWEAFQAYTYLLWQNLNDIDYLHRSLLPEYKSTTIGWEYRIKNNYLNYVSFVLSIAGLVLLLITRQYRAFAVLATVYFYYTLLVGFGRWQGSRIFFPGQIAWSILVAISVASLLRFIRHLMEKVIARRPS